MRRLLPWLPLLGGLLYSLFEWPFLVAEVDGARLRLPIDHALLCVLGATLAVGAATVLLLLARERHATLALTAWGVLLLGGGTWFSVTRPHLPALVAAIALPLAFLCARVVARDLHALLRGRPLVAARRKALLSAALAAAAVAFNRTWFPAHYFLIHVAVTAIGLSAAALSGGYLLARVGTIPRGGAPVLLLTLLASLVPLELGNDARHAMFIFSTEARSISYLLRRLAHQELRAEPAPRAPTNAEAPSCPPALPRVRRVLLVVIDTLRADHLETYGYGRATAPEIARLAAGGTVFERAWSSAPATRAALRHLFAHPIAPRSPTLGAMLQRNKILHRAVVPAHIDAITRDFLGGELDPIVSVPPRDGEAEDDDVAAAVASLAGDAEGLTWVHLLAPHHPYRAHADADFGRGDANRYDGEIRHADRALGEILRVFEARGWLDETAVIVTSDHGEELREHGATTHNRYGMFDEEVHIPLIVRLPGAPPRRVAEPVNHDDLAATTAALLGACPTTLPGRSLLPALDGRALPPMASHLIGPRTTFETGALFAPPWKLTFIRFTGTFGLHHLDDDPHDRRNLYEARPEIAGPLVRQLEARLATGAHLDWDP